MYFENRWKEEVSLWLSEVSDFPRFCFAPYTGTVQYFFPGKTDAEIKGYIRQKLQNEAKRLRKKPCSSDHQDSGVRGQGSQSDCS